MRSTSPSPSEIDAAYQDWDRTATIANFKVTCYLGLVLMPAGTVLDYFVYPDRVVEFLKLRLLCDVLIAGWLSLLATPFAKKHCRSLGVALAMLPAFFISLMIYRIPGGASSPYYAGLNLVLLAVGFVMNWTFLESLVATTLIIIMYLAACLANGSIHQFGIFFNNVYFLSLTGIIVVTGRFFHSKIRYNEFAFRYQLDQSKQELEFSNSQLSEKNTELEKANRDIREAEAQLVQSEKMASLGLLAAKIAHEIRNPLNYARMNLDTLRKRFKNLPPEQHAEAGAIVADMSDGFTRIDSIVSDLLTFSQPGGQEPEPVDVAHIFKTTLRYVANQLEEKNIRLEQNLTLGHLIWVNRQQFNQVLVNLLENSIDALSAKEFSGDDQPTITVSCRLENDRQLISIRDNGAGIDPQNLAKIFDPFFTTKDIGKGTGLGLSICFGIVRGYSGNLRVESAPGKFCEFIIDLPANDPSKPAHGNA